MNHVQSAVKENEFGITFSSLKNQLNSVYILFVPYLQATMEQQNRQLAAILFTDIVGYTAMMQKDEQKRWPLRDITLLH